MKILKSQTTSYRCDRVAIAIRDCVSALLTGALSDPRLLNVGVTHVVVTKDLKLAKVYVCGYGPNQKEGSQVLAGFESARGFIRRRIAEDIRLRYTPEIQFYYDATPRQVERIESILESIQKDPS